MQRVFVLSCQQVNDAGNTRLVANTVGLDETGVSLPLLLQAGWHVWDITPMENGMSLVVVQNDEVKNVEVLEKTDGQ